MPEARSSAPPHAVTAAAPREEPRPLFFYDLGDPCCYLAAERVTAVLPVAPTWVPVAAGQLGIAPPADPAAVRAEVEAVAARRGLQPLRWPPGWPARDVRPARLAATYAAQVGRAAAFSLAAFRQAFAGGRDLGDVDAVVIAAAACELHPRAVLTALDRPAVATALARAGARAARLGVRRLPAVAVGAARFEGDAGLEAAAAALGAGPSPEAPR